MQKKDLLAFGKRVGDLCGVGVTAISFATIFITFVVTIISRYILKTPVAWSYEIAILAYMWTMFFGVGKAMERDEHVVFGLVYDSVSPRTQLIFRLTYHGILIILLAIIIVPSVDSLLAKKMVTGVLKLPYKIVFAPLIFMFVDIMIRSIILLLQDIKQMCGHYKNDSENSSEEVSQ